MPDRWVYSPDGTARFYQKGRYLYSAKTHNCEYYEQDGYIYPMSGVGPTFYVRGNWWYTMQGDLAYHYR